MKTSPEGALALIIKEAIVPGPYRDSVGVWTYGVGHTAAAGAPDPAKMPRGMPKDVTAAINKALRQFVKDLAIYEREVRQAIKVPVTQQQFDAAVSFHFNTGAIARATWVETLNKGNVTLAARQIMNWSLPPEVVPRREAEQELFLEGRYAEGRATVWHVSTSGKVIWKPERTLSSEYMLGVMYPKSPAEKTKTKVASWFAALVAMLTGSK